MTSTFWGLVPPVNASEPLIWPTEPLPESFDAALSVIKTRGFSAAAKTAAITRAGTAVRANVMCIISSPGSDFNWRCPFRDHTRCPLRKTVRASTAFQLRRLVLNLGTRIEDGDVAYSVVILLQEADGANEVV